MKKRGGGKMQGDGKGGRRGHRKTQHPSGWPEDTRKKHTLEEDWDKNKSIYLEHAAVVPLPRQGLFPRPWIPLEKTNTRGVSKQHSVNGEILRRPLHCVKKTATNLPTQRGRTDFSGVLQQSMPLMLRGLRLSLEPQHRLHPRTWPSMPHWFQHHLLPA